MTSTGASVSGFKISSAAACGASTGISTSQLYDDICPSGVSALGLKTAAQLFRVPGRTGAGDVAVTVYETEAPDAMLTAPGWGAVKIIGTLQ
jgi:hypothetical protein